MSKGLSLWRTPSDLMANFDHIFNEMFNKAGFGNEFELSGTYPKLDIYEDNYQVLIEASVPGLSKENVNVDWSNNQLTISGSSSNDKTRKSNNYSFKELHRSSFSRSMYIDERTFDVENIKAEVVNGLLTIKIPRKVQVQAEVKKIEVK